PQLKGIYKTAVEKPKIEVYEGKEGVKTVMDDIVRTKQEALVYCSTRKQMNLLTFYFPNFIKRRIKNKIRIKVLAEASKTAMEYVKTNKQELREMRFLPIEMEFPTATYIYGNKVAIMSLEKDIIGVVIESETIAKTQRIVFDLLWSAAHLPPK
ncbi:hypothetical protein KY328_05465, partial [Candidatus Woesearchaeota archaeon]|nr:hypothetical protein [Candidatus Woesearchaeota archaeon]